MKCPKCGNSLKKIPPCDGEWICVTEDCSLKGRELYGNTQKDVNEIAEILSSSRIQKKEAES